jgi:glutaredoxin-like protein NrdH
MNVTVYTLPACVQCDSTKKMLTRAHVEYTEIDLSTDAAAMEKIRELGYTQAPIVEAGNQHWSGFRMERLQGLIKAVHGESAKQ